MGKSAKKRTASIKDVAALAGVSVPTVSRYMNARQGVSKEKGEKIAQAIQLLNYRPSPIARALVRDRTNFIAVISTNTVLYGPAQTIRGIESACSRAGYSLNIEVLTDLGQGSIQRSVQRCLDQNPAGVILLDFDSLSHEINRYLPPSLPLVKISGENDASTAQISLCERKSGYVITKHLLSLGHKSIYHVSIPGNTGEDSRLDGWRVACEEAGVFTPAPIQADWDSKSARLIGLHLGRNVDVTAVFAGNDEIAMGLIRGLTDAGRRVPEDVSVAGFDDQPLSTIWNPSLTTVHQQFDIAGQEAFTLLQAKIDDLVEGRGHTENWTRHLCLPGKLIIRDSTCSP